jgi:hypothetical protein
MGSYYLTPSPSPHVERREKAAELVLHINEYTL